MSVSLVGVFNRHLKRVLAFDRVKEHWGFGRFILDKLFDTGLGQRRVA
jgi:hypothetical protein